MARCPHHSFLLLLISVCLMAVLSTGCSSRRKSGATETSAGLKQAQSAGNNYVKSALEYTLSIERYEEKGFKERMIESLNNWARTAVPTPDWQPDPMVESLPKKFKSIPAVESIDKFEFVASDADYLQQAIWAKSITDRIINQSSDGAFQYMVAAACYEQPPEKVVEIHSSDQQLRDALELLYPQLKGEQVDQLTWACQLFDWTVRNIQLDEMPVRYSGEALTQKAKDFVDIPSGDAAADGVEGPGYTKSPGQTFLTGKGDAWQKSRAYMLLCRQAGIESVLLTVVDRNDPTLRDPWAVGVIVGDRIFLFDIVMGLPIPSKDYRRIATFDEVHQDRSILTQLRYKLSESTDANPDYRIPPDQIDKTVAWIDASPSALSQRMERLQARLVGDYKAKIACRPSQLLDFLKTKPFVEVSLSPLPFQHRQYQNTFDEAIERRKDKALIRNYMQYEYFKMRMPIKKIVRKNRIDEQSQSIQSGRQIETVQVTIYLLLEARHRFLLGVFESDMQDGKNTLGARKLSEDLEIGRETQDAAQMFVNLTMDDSRISEIMNDDQWLTLMGLAADSNTGMSDQEVARLKTIFEAAMKLIRTDSSVWLALTNFESGDFGNALNWFKQIPRFDNTQKWTDLVNYNLARTEEALHKYSQAVEKYRNTPSQQKFGNIMRARLIARWNLGDKTATEPE